MRSTVSALVLSWAFAFVSPVEAQLVDLTVPDPIASELADVRLAHLGERRDAGLVLFATGLASVLAGGVVAGAMNEDPFWLMFGLGTAGWGAINAGLALGLLDLGGGAQRGIEDDRALRGSELLRLRERTLREQHESATIFALNVGLDVFYVATGLLLFFLAETIDDPRDREHLRGYSVAMTGQGAFLFGFDLVEWIASAARADRVAAIEAR